MSYKYLFLLIFLANSSYGAGLTNKIKELVKNHGFSLNSLGIYVQEVNKKKPLVAINSRKLFTPASVVKLATTYAALLELGPNYRWPTNFYTNGTLKNGVLKGNLVIKAFGNPDLITEDLEPITQAIANQGLKIISGDLIIDRSYFKTNNNNSARFDKNIYSPYNALPDAMMFNHRASKILLKPGENKIRVLRDLPDTSYVILNHLKPSKKSCSGKRAWPKIKLTTYKNKPAIKFHGIYSLRCPEREIYRVMTKPYYMFYHGLKFKLAARDIWLKGILKLRKIPKNSKKLFIFESRPLLKIISKINKKSNNVMARQTLLTLGAKKYGAGATYKTGVKAVNHSLRQHNVINNPLKIKNGSGLSRSAKLSALALTKILWHAYNRFGTSWKNTLAIMGVDGTLKKRLRKSKIKGKAWMKTGSLKNTISIAGYLKTRSNKLYTVVILQNDKNVKKKGQALHNKILQLLHSSI